MKNERSNVKYPLRQPSAPSVDDGVISFGINVDGTINNNQNPNELMSKHQ